MVFLGAVSPEGEGDRLGRADSEDLEVQLAYLLCIFLFVSVAVPAACVSLSLCPVCLFCTASPWLVFQPPILPFPFYF